MRTNTYKNINLIALESRYEQQLNHLGPTRRAIGRTEAQERAQRVSLKIWNSIPNDSPAPQARPLTLGLAAASVSETFERDESTRGCPRAELLPN